MTQPLAALAWCPFPDHETARRVSAVLLDEGLIACANILAEMESLFEWDGERGSGREIPVLFKTHHRQLERMIDRLGALHPYDTPAILAWPCPSGHPSTLAWLGGLASEERS